MSSRLRARTASAFLASMWIEAMRIGFVVIGGGLAVFLAVAPKLACGRYARAVVEGRDRAAGFWAFLAAGGGSRQRGLDLSDSPDASRR